MPPLGALFPGVAAARRFSAAAPTFNPLTDLPGLVFLGNAPGTGTAPSYSTPNTNPGTLTGTAPAWDSDHPAVDGLTGCLNFNTTGALSYVLCPTVTFAAGQAGVGKMGFGGCGAATFWFKLPSSKSIASYTCVFLRADSNCGLYWNSNKYDFYGPTGGDHFSSGAPTKDAWVHCTLNQTPELQMEVWENNSRVINILLGSSVALDDFGGSRASSTYNSGARMDDLRIWPRDLAASEIATLITGGRLTIDPIRVLRCDDGSGTSAADSARTIVDGSLVSSFTDISGLANHHTTSGTTRPRYAAVGDGITVAYPANKIQTLGQDGVLRFNASGSNMLKAGLFGAAESAVSAFVSGMLWDHYQGSSSYHVTNWIWGASNNGNYGSAAGDQWIALGYTTGTGLVSTGSTSYPQVWQVGCKGSGGSPVIVTAPVTGGLVNSLPISLGVAYGSSLLKLLVNGTVVASGAAPASLNLSGNSEFSPTAAPAGFQFYSAAIGKADWS